MLPVSLRIVLERVLRLAEFEHHVIRDVDDRGDRTDAAALDATTVMQRSYEVTLYKSTRQAATFVLAGSDGKNFERKATGYSKLADDGIHSSRLTRFLSPANISGTAVLSVENSDREDDVWVYLPALHKVRRLAAGESLIDLLAIALENAS